MPNNNRMSGDPELDALLAELMKLQGGGLREDEMFAPQFGMNEAASSMGGMGKSMGQAGGLAALVEQMRKSDPNSVVRESEAKMMMDRRKRLTPEQIHNYGVMYGEPLSQQQIDYFEDQLNRDPNQSYMGEFPQYPK